MTPAPAVTESDQDDVFASALWPNIDKDGYWSLVKRTLDKVFDARHKKKEMDDLRKKIDSAQPLEQVYFYHAEPLDVAADLAGRNLASHPITVQEKRAYLNIKQIEDQPSDEQLGHVVTED